MFISAIKNALDIYGKTTNLVTFPKILWAKKILEIYCVKGITLVDNSVIYAIFGHINMLL